MGCIVHIDEFIFIKFCCYTAKIMIKPQCGGVRGTGEVSTEIKTCLLCQLCRNDFKKSLMDATAVAETKNTAESLRAC